MKRSNLIFLQLKMIAEDIVSFGCSSSTTGFINTAQTITVPWTNKNIGVEFATFRDKTLPGSEEKWKVKLTGYKNEKVAAEMLASMYDASLDQFYFHQWYKPEFLAGELPIIIPGMAAKIFTKVELHYMGP